MRAVYGDGQIVLHGDEVGRLETIELNYLRRFDGATVKLDTDGDNPRLVISVRKV